MGAEGTTANVRFMRPLARACAGELSLQGTGRPRLNLADGHRESEGTNKTKNNVHFFDLCVSSLRRGHANLLCIVPILSDD